MEKLKILKYSKFYSKLQSRKHTTIRRYKKGKKLGDIFIEKVGERQVQKVKIIDIFNLPLSKVSTSILLRDTDCLTRECAERLIQSFYPKPIGKDEKIFIFYLEVVK